MLSEEEVIRSIRATIGATYLSGMGLEVGAGDRPFPVPGGSQMIYGDIRNQKQVAEYFLNSEVVSGVSIDAQTMQGIGNNAFDFIISCHVLEHLFDPIGSILACLRCLKEEGILILCVPEMLKTWDRKRPPTTLHHLLMDYKDGGVGTKQQAYIEHAKYVHPEITGIQISEEDIEHDVEKIMSANMDIHVHAWRHQDLLEILNHLSKLERFKIEAYFSYVNENLYVLKKIC
jgi:SAM-dependent methyltransferase